nr:hypothetical protein [uncultured Flavobacterium sp.]
MTLRLGYPIVPALYILVATGICLTLLVYETVNTGIGLAIVALGIPIYYAVFKKE